MGILKRLAMSFRACLITSWVSNIKSVLCLAFLLTSQGFSQFRVVEQSLMQEGLVVPYTIAEGPHGLRVLHLATESFADEIAVTWYHDFGWELTQHLIPGGAETVHHLMQTNAKGKDFRYDLKLQGVACTSSLEPDEWWFQYHGREKDLENILTTHRQHLSTLGKVWASSASDWAMSCAERLEWEEERMYRRLLYSSSEPKYAKRYSSNTLNEADIPSLIRNMLAPNRLTVVVSGGSWENLRDLLPVLLPVPSGRLNWEVNVAPFKALKSDYGVSGPDSRLTYLWRTDGSDAETNRYMNALSWILNEPGSYLEQKFGRYLQRKPRTLYSSTEQGGVFGVILENVRGSLKGLKTSVQLRRPAISDALSEEDLRRYTASYRWDMLSAYEDLRSLSLLYVRDLVRFRNVSQHMKEWKMVETMDLFSLKKKARDLFSCGALVLGGDAKNVDYEYPASLWKNLNTLGSVAKMWEGSSIKTTVNDTKAVIGGSPMVKTSKYGLHWEVTESERYQTCRLEWTFPLPEFSEIYYLDRSYEHVVSQMFGELLEANSEWMDWVTVTNVRWGWKVEDKVVFHVQLDPRHAQSCLQVVFDVLTNSFGRGFEGLENWNPKAVQDIGLWSRRAIQPQNTEVYISSALRQRFFTAGWKKWKKWKPSVLGVLPAVSLAPVGDKEWSYVYLEGKRSKLENLTLGSLVLQFPGAEYTSSAYLRVPTTFSVGLLEGVSDWQDAFDSWSPELYGNLERFAAHRASSFVPSIFQWKSANPEKDAIVKVAICEENKELGNLQERLPSVNSTPVVKGGNFEEAFRYAKENLKPEGYTEFIWKGERYSIREE